MRVSVKAKQSLAAVLLFVACGGVSHRDGSHNGDPSGSGARNGTGSGATGSGAASSGSGATSPIPGTGGYGNTAGFYSDTGGTVGIGGSGNTGGGSGGMGCSHACFESNVSIYTKCFNDPVCWGCFRSYLSACADNQAFRELDAFVCNNGCAYQNSCHVCTLGPTGAGGEGGGNDGYGGEPGSAGYGGGE